jgi:hypothetical protein
VASPPGHQAFSRRTRRSPPVTLAPAGSSDRPPRRALSTRPGADRHAFRPAVRTGKAPGCARDVEGNYRVTPAVGHRTDGGAAMRQKAGPEPLRMSHLGYAARTRRPSPAGRTCRCRGRFGLADTRRAVCLSGAAARFIEQGLFSPPMRSVS